MKIKHLTSDFATAGQITLADLPMVAALGFRSVICNRPDGEDIAQPLFADVVQSAQNAGLEAVYLPISRTGPTPQDHEQFAQVCKDLPRPILAYCASGRRSTLLFNRGGVEA